MPFSVIGNDGDILIYLNDFLDLINRAAGWNYKRNRYRLLWMGIADEPHPYGVKNRFGTDRYSHAAAADGICRVI